MDPPNSSSPRTPRGTGENGLSYTHMTMDELVALCRKRGIRLGKGGNETKFHIIKLLKEYDRNPTKGGFIGTLCRRLWYSCAK